MFVFIINMMNGQLIIEIIIVSVMTAIIGTTLTYIGMGDERNKFNGWGKIVLIFSLTGAIIHLLCEYTRLNKMYCKYGNACKK